MIDIDVLDVNSQSIEAVLDDQLYYIIMDWNDTGQYWEMGIRNYAYQTLVDGIAVVPNYPLLKQFQYPDLPPGSIQVLRRNDDNGPPPRDGFSSGKYFMIYLTALEMIVIDAI